MNDKRFKAVLTLLIPQIISIITEKQAVSEIAAAERFYSSDTYSYLEKEDTKVWHYSPLTIYNMYVDETETGRIEFPEET